MYSCFKNGRRSQPPDIDDMRDENDGRDTREQTEAPFISS